MTKFRLIALASQRVFTPIASSPILTGRRAVSSRSLPIVEGEYLNNKESLGMSKRFERPTPSIQRKFQPLTDDLHAVGIYSERLEDLYRINSQGCANLYDRIDKYKKMVKSGADPEEVFDGFRYDSQCTCNILDESEKVSRLLNSGITFREILEIRKAGYAEFLEAINSVEAEHPVISPRTYALAEEKDISLCDVTRRK